MTTSPTTPLPTSLFTLSDGSTTLEAQTARLIQADGKVIPANHPEGLRRDSVGRTAIQIANDTSHYGGISDPWREWVQEDWSAGRGIYYFEDDKSRYQDAGGVYTPVANQLTLSGLPEYSGGNEEGDAPLEHLYRLPTSGDVFRHEAMYDSTRYLAHSFSPTATLQSNRLKVIVGKNGVAVGNLRVDIYSDSAGSPNASLANGALTSANFGVDEVAREIIIDLNTTLTLTAGTTYWFVASTTSNGAAATCWTCLTFIPTKGGTAKTSANGSSWSTATYAPYFACLDFNVTATDKVAFRYFDYKAQLYCLKIPEEGSNFGVIERNGFRGAADSNAGALNKLKDSTQTTWQNYTSVVGGVAKVIKGPGSAEHQPWRNITAAASGELTVDPPWITEHTTETEYVILGTDVWVAVQILSTLGVQDVEVAGEYYYVVYGGTGAILRAREYNASGVWTVQFGTDESVEASGLTHVYEQETGKSALYGCDNDHALGPVYWKMYVPPAWGPLYRAIGELAPTDTPWNAVVTSVTQSVGAHGTKMSIPAVGFTTGTASSHDLDTPLNISQGGAVGVLLNSSVAGTDQLSLRLSNRTYAQQQKLLADYVFHTIRDNYRVATSVTTMVPSTGAHTPVAKLYDGLDDSTDTIPLTTTNDLVVISDAPYNTIQANITVANTTTPLTLTAEYFNGEEFVAHTITGNFGGVANTPFGATGKQTITFNMPGDWAEYTANSVTGYAMRLKCSGTLLAATALAEVAVIDTEAYANRSFSNGRDGNDTTDEAFNIGQGDALTVGKSERFDRVVVTMGSVVNANAATLACYYFNGEELVTCTIATDGTASAGATLAQTGTITVTLPSDWRQETFNSVTAYYLHFQVSAALTDDILIAEVSVYLDEAAYTVNSGTLVANTWAWVNGAITPGSNLPDEAIIRNVSLVVNSDGGAQTVELKDGIQLISYYPTLKLLPQRATNIVSYGTGNQRVEPIVFFPGLRPHRIDTLNNDALVPILITGFETIASEANGRAATHAGVYLYFSLGPRLARYYDGSLESVGPDLDKGLPNNRQGIISHVITYAGDQVIYAVDAATRDPRFISAVYLRSGSGTHEIYRAPQGEPIRHLHVQVIDGLKSDYLWINVGSELCRVPIPSYTSDPLKDLDADGTSNFAYTWDGYIDLGYITDGMREKPKIFQAMRLITNNLDASRLIRGYYKKNDDTAWTKLPSDYTTDDTTINFATGFVNAKKLAPRLRLKNSGSYLVSPVVEAVIVSGLVIHPASYTYPVFVRVADYDADVRGIRGTARAKTPHDQLDTWRNAGTVLTFRNQSNTYDNKLVVINTIGSQLTSLEARTNKESLFASVNLFILGSA